MNAVYISEFGRDLENLGIKEVPDPPDPGIGEVLVRVRAAGLNRADLLQARGLYPPPVGFSAHIPGLEFAGEISSIGPDVRGWNVGDRVFAITSGEAQAELVRIDHRLLMRVPEALSFTEAAAIPEAFITAHDAVFSQAKLRKDETLLIHAVGSGVGLAALQLGRSLGSAVIGTSRTGEKLERCRDLGLDAGIQVNDVKDLSAAVLENTGGRGADVILDLVGAAYFQQDLASLAIKGRLMLVGLTSGATAEIDLSTVLNKRAKIIGTMLRGRSVDEKAKASRQFADHALPLLASGHIVPNIDRVFPAAEAADAYKYLASNESFGKVVLRFSP